MKKRRRAYRGKSGDERAAERRARLIAAGRSLLRSGGWARTSVRAVCARAGLADRYFYESFPDRDGLLAVVFDQVAGEAVAGVAEALTRESANPAARARAAVEAVLDRLGAEPGTARVALFETPDSPVIRRHRRSAVRRFVALIGDQAAILYGSAASLAIDRELTAHALVGAFQELLTAVDHGEIKVSRARLVSYAVALAEAVALVSSAPSLRARRR